jgi:hypothetical protein
VQALTLEPSATRNHCKFGERRFIEACMEWLRLIVFEYPLPQIVQSLGISLVLDDQYIK